MSSDGSGIAFWLGAACWGSLALGFDLIMRTAGLPAAILAVGGFLVAWRLKYPGV